MSMTFMIIAGYLIIGIMLAFIVADRSATVIDNDYKKIPNAPHLQEAWDNLKSSSENMNLKPELVVGLTVVVTPFIWLPLIISMLFMKSS